MYQPVLRAVQHYGAWQGLADFTATAKVNFWSWWKFGLHPISQRGSNSY